MSALLEWTDVFDQTLLLDDQQVKVTFQPATPVPRPVQVEGRTILEPGSPAVWFTFPGAWHDIGRFHDARGRFTGIYANVLTPCTLHESGQDPLRWDTTDLFLDVWLGADGEVRLLDEDDVAAAEAAGHVTSAQAERAREEAREILRAQARGAWPPPVVTEWTLERARYSLSRRS